MNNVQIIETLCRVIEELAAFVADDQRTEALRQEVNAALGETTDRP